MKDKLPYNVTNWLRFYNIFQVIACTVFVVRTYNLGFDFRFLWRCESFDFLNENARLEIQIGLWCFLLLRIFEFSETIVFVLRKKKNQASFLHIYHHVSTVVLMWVFITFDTGEKLSTAFELFL
jgi:GNS1/SUR4 family